MTAVSEEVEQTLTAESLQVQRLVTGRAAEGEERDRLWDRWRAINQSLDAYAALRPTQTAVVVLESRPRQCSRMTS
ncbi:MAG TPA: hypothetical protein VMM13_09350 [Euzebya sp.]|nr:hypothetical protein [Euzebya sp.]